MTTNKDKALETKMNHYTLKYYVNDVPQPPMKFKTNAQSDFLEQSAREYVKESLKGIEGVPPRVDVYEIIENE